jgi:hypothetical protein
MDAGVPIKAPVAGIAMGLIKEGDAFAVLSDIVFLVRNQTFLHELKIRLYSFHLRYVSVLLLPALEQHA